MNDLFNQKDSASAPLPPHAPLAARMRPRTLDEFVGQGHILGHGRMLRRAIEADCIQSLIFYGPPGTGKTSLAQIIAHSTSCHFEHLSGVESSVGDIRKVAAAAADRLRASSKRTLLFVDEIHRFNKAQQDVLLPDVESGVLRLIGATTHNPFFYVVSALVSRSQIFQLEPIGESDLAGLLRTAVSDPLRGLGGMPLDVEEDALVHLAAISDGDARRALNALELASLTTPRDETGRIRITLDIAEQSIQQKTVVYDGDGDAHYDTISAFIKSMRGCDPDATLYWLAKMLHAGEDIRFIARRIVICASEDVGLADSHALVVAVAAQQAVEFLGMPEARIPLAHAAVYIATAPKSNRAYAGIEKALSDVKSGRTLAVPRHLRDGSYRGAKHLGNAQGYQSPHDILGEFTPQASLPDGRIYYEPTENGLEKRVKERLDFWRTRLEKVEKK